MLLTAFSSLLVFRSLVDTLRIVRAPHHPPLNRECFYRPISALDHCNDNDNGNDNGNVGKREIRLLARVYKLSPSVQAVLVQGHPLRRAGSTQKRFWRPVQRGVLSPGELCPVQVN